MTGAVYFLAARRMAALADPKAAAGYLTGLEIGAAVCLSHIASATRKFGAKSDGVRIGRADLCCIEREIRRVLAVLATNTHWEGVPEQDD